jgi:hypothetical protein
MSGGGDETSAMGGPAYGFATPVLNSIRNYTLTSKDSENSGVDIPITMQITAVNADGSFNESSVSNGVVTVNGISFGLPEYGSFNSQGQELSLTYPTSGGGTGMCTFDPHGAGPPFPIMVGQTWTLEYSYTCNGGVPISYTQNGTVVDVETVTVPGGTFSALKLESTLTWTDANGTTHQENVSNWRDVATLRSVKEVRQFSVSGTPPAGAVLVSEQLELQSTS